MNADIKYLLEKYLQCRKVTTDTRQNVEGAIFFALKGDRFDGNQFTTDALENGAVLAVTQDPARKAWERHFYVPDTLQALQDLACQFRHTLQIPVIGITGSNGKTTTKELVLRVLSQKYRTHATTGNLNNHIGVPLTLLSIPSDAEMAIIEMGANYPDEIAELASIAHPNVGIITSIGKAHLEGFGSLDVIARTKSALFQSVMEKHGMLFYHSTISDLVKPYVQDYDTSICIGQDTIVVGRSAIHFKLIQEVPSIRFEIKDGQQKWEGSSYLLGSYNFQNILLALASGLYFGVELPSILEAIAAYQPSNNRTQRVQFGIHTVLLDAYNANPTSMHAAIQAFAMANHDRRVLVLGGMKEMGSSSDVEHQQLVDYLNQYPWYKVFLVGSEFDKVTISGALPVIRCSREEASAWLEAEPQACMVLIKGSRAYALEKMIPT
jgi:UDP-N-acetylmuramoyl-tripeptide--D-alanyl-D-alanine ligase